MDFDVIVIGAGPGGYPAAIKAAKMGAKTAIIEREWLGGTCLNCGCIPTKTLIAGAEAYQKILHAESFGIKVNQPEIDYTAMKNRKDQVVETLKGGIGSLLKAHGITVYEGTGGFKDANTVPYNLPMALRKTSPGKTSLLLLALLLRFPDLFPRISVLSKVAPF